LLAVGTVPSRLLAVSGAAGIAVAGIVAERGGARSDD
jgi:hypothetical protein